MYYCSIFLITHYKDPSIPGWSILSPTSSWTGLAAITHSWRYHAHFWSIEADRHWGCYAWTSIMVGGYVYTLVQVYPPVAECAQNISTCPPVPTLMQVMLSIVITWKSIKGFCCYMKFSFIRILCIVELQ